MHLRSDYIILHSTLIYVIVQIIFFTAFYIVSIITNKNDTFIVILCTFGILVAMLYGLQYIITFGREIELTEEGCIVHFLGFSKLYLWNQMKTKRRVQISIGDSRNHKPYYNGVLLSCREEFGLKKDVSFYQRYVYNVPTYHPFSLVFIVFEPRLNPEYQFTSSHLVPERRSKKESGYFADEEQLLALLHSWGVNLDDEKAGDI